MTAGSLTCRGTWHEEELSYLGCGATCSSGPIKCVQLRCVHGTFRAAACRGKPRMRAQPVAGPKAHLRARCAGRDNGPDPTEAHLDVPCQGYLLATSKVIHSREEYELRNRASPSSLLFRGYHQSFHASFPKQTNPQVAASRYTCSPCIEYMSRGPAPPASGGPLTRPSPALAFSFPFSPNPLLCGSRISLASVSCTPPVEAAGAADCVSPFCCMTAPWGRPRA